MGDVVAAGAVGPKRSGIRTLKATLRRQYPRISFGCELDRSAIPLHPHGSIASWTTTKNGGADVSALAAIEYPSQLAPLTRPARQHGQRAKGEHTKRHIAEALLVLVEDGDPAPTAKAIAEQAGVSLRLIFHHFQELDTLYRMALKVKEQQALAFPLLATADGPLEHRVERTVAQRAKAFSAVSPIRSSFIALAASRSWLISDLTTLNALMRSQVQSVFADEISLATNPKDLLEALDAALSWEAWHRLCAQGLSGQVAKRVMTKTASALLGC